MIKRFKISFILLILAIGVIIFMIKGYLIIINRSDSLAFKWVLIEKGRMPSKKGDIFAFWTDGGGLYRDKRIFVKKLVSNKGSLIKIDGDEVNIDGVFMGRIKKYLSSGRELNAIEQKIVKKGQYFAFAPHPKSFDSRYKEIGLINEKDIIGIAIFIF